MKVPGFDVGVLPGETAGGSEWLGGARANTYTTGERCHVTHRQVAKCVRASLIRITKLILYFFIFKYLFVRRKKRLEKRSWKTVFGRTECECQ